MKQILFITISIVSILKAYSQGPIKVFLDKNFDAIDSINAYYVRKAIIENGHYFITDQNLKGETINYGEFISINPWVEDGLSKHYILPNKLYSTGNYLNGKLTGKWVYYSFLNELDTVSYDIDEKQFCLSECDTKFKELKKSKSKSKKTKPLIDSLSLFFEKKFHLPARTRSASTSVSASIDLILDTDGKVKCPLISRTNDEDFKTEILRVLSQFEFVNSNEVPIRLNFDFFYDELTSMNKRIFGTNNSKNFLVPLSSEELDSISSIQESNSEENDSTEVFVVVEVMPTFKNKSSGDFRNYIGQNLRYPEAAAKNGIKGKVFVQFIVETDGSVSNVKIVKGAHPLLDKEAKRVIESSPKWQPGKQRGQPVRVSFTFPIIFEL
jgi:TonB family protein